MGRRLLRRPYSLVSLVIVVNLMVLALPIIGIAALRIFETVIHRQTEAKLISEGAYVSALYTAALHDKLGKGPLIEPLFRRVELPETEHPGKWRPYFPEIDLASDKVLPPAPDGVPPTGPVHPAELAAGREVQPILEEAQFQNLSGVRILDATGVVVASTGAERGLDLTTRSEIGKALAGEYAAVLRRRVDPDEEASWVNISRNSKVRVFVALPILEGEKLLGVVYLSRTSLSVTWALWDIRNAIAIALVLAAAILISLVLALLVTRPIKSLSNRAEQIAAGEKNVSLEVGATAPAEAHRLAEALSKMLEKLNERVRYVQEFTRNVSHELKTPLTSIQGAVELLDENWEEMDTAERKRFLKIVDTEVRRMDRLVKRLLELARLEMAEPARAETELAELLRGLARHYRETGHPVELVEKVQDARARMAPDQAENLFTNLLDNAISHGRGAEVEIKLEPGPAVTVSDRGPGISEANLKKIFDRFFTTARDRGGTGLGLSMVQAIANANGARVSARSDETGTHFTVAFGRAESGEKPGTRPGGPRKKEDGDGQD